MSYNTFLSAVSKLTSHKGSQYLQASTILIWPGIRGVDINHEPFYHLTYISMSDKLARLNKVYIKLAIAHGACKVKDNFYANAQLQFTFSE